MDTAPPPRRRPYRRRIGIVLAAIVIAALAIGQVSARRAAWRNHLERLRAEAEVCLASGRALAGNWPRLPLDDRRSVCLVLLAAPDLTWDATLEQAWLVDLLADILTNASRPIDRARAARALGQIAGRTALGDGSASLPAGLEPAATALLNRVDRDPEGLVRSAAAAALMRVRPVARSYGLGSQAEPPLGLP